MKKKSAIILCLILAILITAATVVSVAAETIYQYFDYRYTYLNGYSVSIYGWEGEGDTLLVPSHINNRQVASIRNYAFLSDTNLKHIDFSRAENLHSIGMFAFKSCTSLSGSLNFPNELETIGVAAFEDCTALETVVFNTSLVNIPEQCFNRCSLLESVTLSENTQSIGNFAFADCASLTYLEIPSTVTAIGETAFDNDAGLTLGVYSDSYAHTYAVDNGIDYVLIDAPAPTEPTVPTEPTTATEATVPTETAATEPATTAPVSYILGDADNSGNVDVVDATFAQRYVTHAEIPEDILDGIEMRADVDNTGELDSADVTLLMRHLIRVKTPYPIGETVSRII